MMDGESAERAESMIRIREIGDLAGSRDLCGTVWWIDGCEIENPDRSYGRFGEIKDIRGCENPEGCLPIDTKRSAASVELRIPRRNILLPSPFPYPRT